MTFYFYNSYQGSPVGYQLVQWQDSSDQLEPIRTGEIPSEDLRSMFSYGGKAYAIGCDGECSYFIINNLLFRDNDSLEWYGSFCCCADKQSQVAFAKFVRKVLLDFDGFQNAYAGWFIATPEAELSFAVDVAAVSKWLSEPFGEKTSGTDHPVFKQFHAMLNDLAKGISRRLFLLVPESTVTYFFNQNPVFVKTVPQYLFSEREFTALLRGEPLPEQKTGDEQQGVPPLWEQLGISKDLFIRYVLTGVIVCAGFLGTLAYRIHKHTAKGR